jgi:hypothetical protein
MATLVLIVALAVPLALDVWATRLVLADDLSTRGQRAGQLALVWLLPLVGAVIVLGVHRRTEPPSRKYRAESDPGDDYSLSGKTAKAAIESLDGD